MQPDSLAADSLQAVASAPRIWPVESQYHGQPWTQNLSAPILPSHGLLGHHLSLWASHGRYFQHEKGQWAWQRPQLFCTTEDLLTPSFVYPFLIPMLEKAGAVVWTPRERDMQSHSVVADRITSETNKKFYWYISVPEPGDYAVYVRYPSIPEAVPDAVYTIHHGGERTRIAVNQRMGSGTWVYLGTFHFTTDARIELNKQTQYNGRVVAGSIRLGGGTDEETGLPNYLMAARYYAPRAGLPDSLFCTGDGLDDYKDDLRTRSNMLNWLREEKGVPLELQLAVHTDAGYRTDSIPYASLAICTTQDGVTQPLYANVLSRQASHDFCTYLLDGIDRDLSDLHWHQRELRDRNYSETRAPNIPSAIIEMLSHQNFLDARLAHDPIFKFRISRAIYKAILRFTYHVNGLSSPIVQPLPVCRFAALLQDDEAHLSWEATPDTLEPTADPTHYIIYTRVDDGDFDNGQLTRHTHFRQHVLPGHRYTFRITAVNSGGESFPSQQLTVFRGVGDSHQSALLVDAFTRLSGPAYIDTPDSLGLLLQNDYGVPYGETLEYCGPQVNFNRQKIGREGPNALGYSTTEHVGKRFQGNFRNICATRAAQLILADSTISISSIGVDATDCLETATAAFERHADQSHPDFIFWLAGQQRRAPQNLLDFPVWPLEARPFVEEQIKRGSRLIVEGTYVKSHQLSPEERTWWNSLTGQSE